MRHDAESAKKAEESKNGIPHYGLRIAGQVKKWQED